MVYIGLLRGSRLRVDKIKYARGVVIVTRLSTGRLLYLAGVNLALCRTGQLIEPKRPSHVYNYLFG